MTPQQQPSSSRQQPMNSAIKRSSGGDMATPAEDKPEVSDSNSLRQSTIHEPGYTVNPNSSAPSTPESACTTVSSQSPASSPMSSPPPFAAYTRKLEWREPTPVKGFSEGMRKPGGTRGSPKEPERSGIWSRRLIQAVNNNCYRYTRIPADQSRLLIIKPGAPGDEINITLLTVADADLETDHCHYVALSYHWGDGASDRTVIVQDDPGSQGVKRLDDLVVGLVSGAAKEKKFFIRPNLYDALKHLRHSKHPVSAWVDALCINQSDEEEKNEQVGKMAKIYRNAYNVCIWLGSDDDDNSSSAMAMRFIPQAIDPDKHEELLHDENKIQHWASIFELLKWSWFSRRWIVQELALAKEATVHCGNNKPIHWHDFQDAIAIFSRDFDVLRPKLRSYFERSNHPNRTKWNNDADFEIEQLGAKLLVEITSNLFRKNDDGSSESTYGLETLVCLLSGFDTSDPRDTINALINIASEIDREYANADHAIPRPDYTKDLFEVYRDFVRWVVATSKSLDIICRYWALPEREQERPATPRLPSWIQSVDDSAFGRGEEVFDGRKAGGSFVGLPDQGCYYASGKGFSRRDPQVEWPSDVVIDSNAEPTDGRNRPTVQRSRLHDVSMLVTGLVIGAVSFRTEPFPDSVITKDCLERLGWSFQRKATEVTEVPDQLWQTLVANRGPDGTKMDGSYRRACQHVLVKLTRNGHINIDKLLGKTSGYTKAYLERVRSVTWDRSFIEGMPSLTPSSNEASKKLVGLGPPKTKEKDVIAILYGCSVPVILRSVRDAYGNHEGYQFIGEAFIYGKMDGEAFRGGYQETKFRLL